MQLALRLESYDQHLNLENYITDKAQSIITPCGFQGCKNRPAPISWPDVVKGD